MDIKVLGGGCAKCDQLAANTKEALLKLGIPAEVQKVTDYKEIARYGVMSTPALVVDETVQVFGRVPSAEEIVKILSLIKS